MVSMRVAAAAALVAGACSAWEITSFAPQCQKECPVGTAVSPNNPADCVKATALAGIEPEEVEVACSLPAACGKGSSSVQCEPPPRGSIEVTVTDLAAQTFRGDTTKSLTFGRLYDDVPAWGDMPGATFVRVSPFLQGVATAVPGQRMGQGSTIKWHCPNDVSYRCEVFVLMYQCNPCRFVNEPIVALLNNEGWQGTPCRAAFRTGTKSGVEHRMIAFRKSLEPDEEYVLTTTSDAEHLAFGISTHGVNCGDITQLGQCEATTFCRWNHRQAECQQQYCPRPQGPAPPPVCNVCVADEVVIDNGTGSRRR